MKTLLTYVPLFGCSAMMVVCLLFMCGSRLWRRTPGHQTDAITTLRGSAVNATAADVVPAKVLDELSALRSEVAELRRAAAPIQPIRVEERAAEPARD